MTNNKYSFRKTEDYDSDEPSYNVYLGETHIGKVFRRGDIYNPWVTYGERRQGVDGRTKSVRYTHTTRQEAANSLARRMFG